ncbi:ammonia-forming cytochrome c nitrite reductase subunit c552 [Halobacteriovorax sp. RT-2-6]|uniref:ammonia-forming cytochrome c nitrite reductase subunit c552 n=1 Tax=unclassified Halobacteriovorax TaxID=2639665 RepID=UPI0039998377
MQIILNIIFFVLVLIAAPSCFNKKLEVTKFDPTKISYEQLKSNNDPSTCFQCHEDVSTQWSSSDHFHSMNKGTKEFVKGDFNNKVFEANRTKYLFVEKQGQFYISINGLDYKVLYTFGHYPLQQYVVDTGKDGKFQVPPIAWDIEAKRWFNTLSEVQVNHPHLSDSLKWDNRVNNWNNRCASCHSSGLDKSYDFKTDSYKTKSLSENVSCFSCHGDASTHLKWASMPLEDRDSNLTNKGFWRNSTNGYKEIIPAKDGGVHTYITEHDANTTCLTCHSLREDMSDHADFAADFFNQFSLTIVNDNQYHIDGQQKEEAFVGGSFLQSKMFHNGVKCINCHNPHSGKLKKEGSALCLQCHDLSYDKKAHHGHEIASASCVDCHMPKKAFMGIDMRADHKFVIPRPDYSLSYGVPNSCTSCHSDISKEKMNSMFQTKFPNLKTRDELLEIIGEMKKGNFKNKNRLLSYINNVDMPEMKRAAAIVLLREFPSMKKVDYEKLLSSDSILIKKATLELLLNFPDISQLQTAIIDLAKKGPKLLSFSAVYVLATHGLNFEKAPGIELRPQLDSLLTMLELHSDAPDNILKLATLSRFGLFPKTPAQLLEASIKKYPYFIAAYINLADLHRSIGNEAQTVQILTQALNKNPQDGSVLTALGMHYTRLGDYPKALDYFKSASDLNKDNAYFNYLYILTYKQVFGAEQALGEAKKYESRYEASFLFNQLLFALSVELQDVENTKFYSKKINRFRQ